MDLSEDRKRCYDKSGNSEYGELTSSFQHQIKSGEPDERDVLIISRLSNSLLLSSTRSVTLTHAVLISFLVFSGVSRISSLVVGYVIQPFVLYEVYSSRGSIISVLHTCAPSLERRLLLCTPVRVPFLNLFPSSLLLFRTCYIAISHHRMAKMSLVLIFAILFVHVVTSL